MLVPNVPLAAANPIVLVVSLLCQPGNTDCKLQHIRHSAIVAACLAIVHGDPDGYVAQLSTLQHLFAQHLKPAPDDRLSGLTCLEGVSYKNAGSSWLACWECLRTVALCRLCLPPGSPQMCAFCLDQWLPPSLNQGSQPSHFLPKMSAQANYTGPQITAPSAVHIFNACQHFYLFREQVVKQAAEYTSLGMQSQRNSIFTCTHALHVYMFIYINIYIQ